MMRIARRAVASIALVVAGALAVVVAPPAQAVTANANIYGVVLKSHGWVCAGRLNKVVDVRYFNHTVGKNGGDGNDDIVLIPVRTGRTNKLTIGVKCRFGTYMAMNFDITPSRNKQTFWFKLNGTYTKN